MPSLVGDNINDNRLKYEVLQAIHGLRRQERVNGVYRQYVTIDLPIKHLPVLTHSGMLTRPTGEGW